MEEKTKSRQAAYRDRTNVDVRELRRMQDLVAGYLSNAPNPTDRQWFEVDITVNRENVTGTDQYYMDGRNVSRLLADAEKSDQEDPKVGVYACVDRRSAYMPVMLTLVWQGLSVTHLQKIDNYSPPPGYSVSDGAVNLLMKG